VNLYERLLTYGEGEITGLGAEYNNETTDLLEREVGYFR
jgi:hypothetical protein